MAIHKIRITNTSATLLMIFTLLAACMALPKQPDLTGKESEYLGKLHDSCNCDVTREVDPRAEKNNSSEYEGWYGLFFREVPCNILSNRDSLERLSLIIAKHLHNDVLGQEFKYKYSDILVEFRCESDTAKIAVVSFDYTVGELDKDTISKTV